MLRGGKVYVPKDEKLRAEVIWLHHDTSRRAWRTVEDDRVGH